MMKRHIFPLICSIFLFILSGVALTGCGGLFPDIPADPDKNAGKDAETESPAPFSHAKPQAAPAPADYDFPETAPFIDDTGKSMQRDENCFYSYYGGRLIRFDPETDKTVLLYQTVSTHTLNFCLRGNNIYFVERAGYDSPDDRDTSLWRIGKDGRGLTLLQDDILNAGTLHYRQGDYAIDIYDDILYLINPTPRYENGSDDRQSDNLYFRLEHNGTVSEIEESETLYGMLPAGFEPVFDDTFPSLPYAMRNYGYLFIQDSAQTLYRMEPVSGAKESLSVSAEYAHGFSFYGDLVLYHSYHPGSSATLLHLADKTRTQVVDLADKSLSGYSICPAGQAFYFCCNLYDKDSYTAQSVPRFHIFRILSDGSADILLSDPPEAVDSYAAELQKSCCILGDDFYYYRSDTEQYSLMRLPLSESAGARAVDTQPRYRTAVPAAFLTDKKEKKTPIGDKSSVNYSAETLLLAEKTEADRLINRSLGEVYADFAAYVEEIIAEEQNCLAENPDYYDSFAYTSGCDFSLCASLDYLDDDTISFCCDYYQYFSYAAHGYYWSDYYVFDRRTGERLSFEDFAGNSAAIIKIAKPYVEKAAEWEFDQEMLLDISRFSLSEDGYTLYFAPYDIACYAAGSFLITIPYEAFEKKL